MIKNALFICLTIVLIGCTQNNNTSSPQPEEPVIELFAKSGVFSGSSDFGSFNKKDAPKVLTFRLTNNGDEALSSPPALDNNNFTLVSHNCPLSLAVGRNCLIRVMFNPNKPADTYLGNLNIDSVFVQLSATVLQENILTDIAFLNNNQDVSMVDFGEVLFNQTAIKVISIRNTGTTNISGENVSLIGQDFQLLQNTCSGRVIPQGMVCQLRVSLNGAGKNGAVSGQISFVGEILDLQGSVVGAASGGNGSSSPNLIALVSNSEQSSFDFGDVLTSQSKMATIVIKNNGNFPSTAFSASLSNEVDFKILFNQCISRALSTNGQCIVRVLFSGEGKSGTYSSTLNFGPLSFQLQANVVSSEQVISYQAVYTASACSAIPCDGQGQITRTKTGCNQLINGVVSGPADNSNCNIFNAVEYESCLSPAGNGTRESEANNGIEQLYCLAGQNRFAPDVQVIGINCEQNFVAFNGACIASSRACTSPELLALNATAGTANWNGSAYVCQPSTCTSGYTLNNGSCIVAGPAGSVVAGFPLAGETGGTQTSRAVLANRAYAQRFTLSSSMTISAVEMMVTKSGNPGGNILVQIANDVAGNPPNYPIASPLVTQNYSIASIPTSLNRTKITVNLNQVLPAGSYWLFVSGDAGYNSSVVPGSVFFGWVDAVGTPFAGNTAQLWLGYWSPWPQTFGFQLYGY